LSWAEKSYVVSAAVRPSDLSSSMRLLLSRLHLLHRFPTRRFREATRNSINPPNGHRGSSDPGQDPEEQEVNRGGARDEISLRNSARSGAISAPPDPER
jgi:hypothetical protein